MDDDLKAQWAVLTDQHNRLEAEHLYMRAHPHDREGHSVHREKLRSHIELVHAYLERLRARSAELP